MRSEIETLIKSLNKFRKEAEENGGKHISINPTFPIEILAKNAIDSDNIIRILSKQIDATKNLVESNQDTILKLIDMIEAIYERLDKIEGAE